MTKRKPGVFRNVPITIGQRFGRLVVVEFLGRTENSKQQWRLECDCGTDVTALAYNLQNGNTQSCGCYCRDRCGEAGRARIRHAASRKGARTPEYRSWEGIVRRCENPSCNDYSRYGGRGISICAEWRNSFEAFLAHVGMRPSPDLSIDRINNNGNYEPGNVRWATAEQQANNRRPHSKRKSSPAAMLAV